MPITSPKVAALVQSLENMKVDDIKIMRIKRGHVEVLKPKNKERKLKWSTYQVRLVIDRETMGVIADSDVRKVVARILVWKSQYN